MTTMALAMEPLSLPRRRVFVMRQCLPLDRTSRRSLQRNCALTIDPVCMSRIGICASLLVCLKGRGPER
jgi:hypothetical protein